MKKLLKKICMFGVSAATALSFCTPAVEGRTPGTGDRGVLLSNTPLTITKNSTTAPVATFALIDSNNLTFDGNAKQLISSVASVKLGSNALTYVGDNAQVKLYLRVAEKDDATNDGKMPAATTDWVLYEVDADAGTNTLSNASLLKSDANTYYIYYYIDGGNNVRDNGAGADGTGNGT